MIVVLNFGSQVAHLIARRVRELGVFSQIVPHTISAKELLNMQPQGIILSGGPAGVYEKDAPLPNADIFDVDVPILGICYGHQVMARHFGGKVDKSNLKEFGKTKLLVDKPGQILKGLKREEIVWMSHGDSVTKVPSSFSVLAHTKSCKIASFEDNNQKRYAVQFHVEVFHTEKGMQILKNFLFGICKAKKDYNIDDAESKMIAEIKTEVKKNHVLMGISGGVDSTVAAVLFHKAIGEQLHCVFVDHGLLRKNESDFVMRSLKSLKLRHLERVDASSLFLGRLKGVADPEHKRKIIGHTFIEVFEGKARELKKKYPRISFLGQGTIYPDRVESASTSKVASKIKSHHNVTLPDKMGLTIIEPLRDLYKDGVRELGRRLGIDPTLINRHPFPGPGLAIRIVGEITPERLDILRNADAIFQDELHATGWYDKTWQSFAALFPIRSVGVKGDSRVYDYIISLRAVTSADAMTADWAKIPSDVLEHISSRILNEVRGVARVVYDISQKPPATIEYE